MKTLTCSDLGGPCDQLVAGDTFEEMGENCKTHVMEAINAGDEAHATAAGKMRDATPEEQQAMMAEYKKKFDEAAEL